jgi:hypothetical protein
MTTEAGERKRTTVSVRGAESTSGRYGPQWTLTVSYPWSRGKTSKAWIPRDEFMDAVQPGMYECLVEKGPKWADDTDEDWGYNWRIVEFGSTAAPVVATPDAPLPTIDPHQDYTNRRTALMQAVAFSGEEATAKDVGIITQDFYDILNGLQMRTEEERDFDEPPPSQMR